MDPTLDPQLAQALQQSPNYVNPSYLTPEQVANLRATAQGLLQNQPEAKSWAGVLGSMANAWASSRMRDQAAAQDQARGAAAAAAWNPANFGGAAPQAGGMPSAAPANGAVAPGAGANAGDLASFYAPKLGAAGAAGLVGGFGAESGYQPGAVGDAGTSAGLGQWHGDRRQNLVAFASKYGASPTDPNIQKQFSLVEMGLAGSPNDPGFGTERRAGAALQAAQTPQQATAAALMYERPAGWSPQHPENANGYSRRLALASALMGGAGGGAAAPTAYAAGGPQPGAGVPWPAQRPQMAGGGGMPPQAAPGPVMAQNGGSPMVGMGAQQISAILANPNIPLDLKRQLLGAQFPEAIPTPGGGTVMQPRGQPVAPQTVSPGVLQTPFGGSQEYAPAAGGQPRTLIPGGFTSTMGVGGQSIPAVTTMGAGGQPNTSLVMPSAGQPQGGGAAPADSGNPLAPVMPIVRAGQGIQAAGSELSADTEAMGAYKTQGAIATSRLGQMETFRALGQGIESGLPAQIKGKLAQYGFDLDSTAGRLQAYKFMAMMLLPPDASEGIRESIPTLSADPQTRGQIADFIENQYKYQKQIGDIAADNQNIPDPSERRRRIMAVKPPQQTFGAPQQPAPTGGTAAGAGAPAAPQPDRLAEARAAIAKGASKDAVIKRLRERGIDPTGL